MPDITFLLIVGPVIFFGSVVQGGVGLGLGLVAAPVVAFLEPSLMPGALLTATAILPVLTVVAEWRHIDWRTLAWALPARLPGSVAGAWLVAVLDPTALGAAVGVMVLLAVAATLTALRIEITPVSLLTAGAASGLTGTATSIGGPPLALVLQHSAAPMVRGTLGAFFVVGASLSLAVLAAGGQLTGEQVWTGLVLVPFVVAGFAASRPLRRRLESARFRAALLGVVALSGLALVLRYLL
ncbi:sulfite exporter TauE/SafE family protein [Streptomyces sp. YIM 98790]|uniref:sulfite exporter TauE/SafE family protein n=1 Tax=Streptomyces sp. YIM 98790 TaxID=2689077 RepID=UPI00140BAC56|nr:sulfite exporter TauE/SafE family protein [Streptomyces sp. YIM 98790]